MPESPDQAFARLATELSQVETVDQTAAQIVAFGMSTVGAQHAGITMLRAGGTFETVGASSSGVLEVDLLQHSLGEGPCVDLAAASRVVLSADLASDERWPRWGPQAAALGLGSLLSAELHAGGRRIGAISLYGVAKRQFSAQDVDVARLFASHAAAALAAVSLREGLQNAIDSRTIIGQAQGILMERFDVEPDRAFSILRRYSQDQNVKLTDVAQALVRTRQIPVGLARPDDAPVPRGGQVGVDGR